MRHLPAQAQPQQQQPAVRVTTPHLLVLARVRTLVVVLALVVVALALVALGQAVLGQGLVTWLVALALVLALARVMARAVVWVVAPPVQPAVAARLPQAVVPERRPRCYPLTPRCYPLTPSSRHYWMCPRTRG